MDPVIRFLSTLTSAMSNCALYSREHASVAECARKSLAILEEVLASSDHVEIMLIEDDLIVNKASFKEIGLQTSNLMKRIKRKGLSRIEFLPGITFEEMRTFIPEILEVDRKLPDFPHIRTGVLDIRTDEASKTDDEVGGDVMSFLSEKIHMIKEIYRDIVQFKRLNIGAMNSAMEGLVAGFSTKANILNLLGYATSREEYAYIHATNVSVLSIFQMKTLGISEKLFLRDIGLAGLLHDIGKLRISREVLGKKTALSDKDWEEVKLHPIYGARILSSLDGLPPLCSIIAFQHHMHYDGKGYPKVQLFPMRQHVCSQVVSIADCFDALRSARPYKKRLKIKEIFPLMQKDSVRAFNPFLLKNFMCRLLKALS